MPDSSSGSPAFVRILLPLGLLALTAVVVGVLMQFKEEPEKEAIERLVPKIRVTEISRSDAAVSIETQGTVSPRLDSLISAQVGGQIVERSDLFESGRRVAQGDLLLRIDPVPYEAALAQAQSVLARARLQLAQEEARATQARQDWIRTHGPDSLDAAPPLTLRQPQLDDAQASVDSAEAALRQAQHNLELTEVRAPFAGALVETRADLGQTVAMATPLARLATTHDLEIRVPLQAEDMVHLTLGDDGRLERRYRAHILSGLQKRAGRSDPFVGYLDRLEAQTDPQSREMRGVIRVDLRDPANAGRLLPIGAFTNIAIEGDLLKNVARIPREALREADTVYQLTADSRLETHSLEVVYRERHAIWATGGLEDGAEVAVTPVPFFVDGMQVAVERDRPAGAVTTDAAPENVSSDD